MINVNSSKLIIVVYMSHYLVLLILEFLPVRLATLPYGLDSNVTQLLGNLLTQPSVFYYLPIVSCKLVSIKLLLQSVVRMRTMCCAIAPCVVHMRIMCRAHAYYVSCACAPCTVPMRIMCRAHAPMCRAHAHHVPCS